MQTTPQMRPPYVRFERRAIEDRTLEIATGKYGFKDVDIAKVTVPGQKDVHEAYVEPWLAQMEKTASDGRIPHDWPQRFRDAYAFWKTGQEAPLNGTPLRGWSVLTPAEQENLVLHGIRTVEDLANLSDEATRIIGIGAVSYRQKAAAWVLESKEKGGVAAENASLRRDLEAANARVEEVSSRYIALEAKVTELLNAKGKNF